MKRFFFLFFVVQILQANEQKHCAAIVEYTASTGDPSKASSSAIFRGFANIAFRERLKVTTRPLSHNCSLVSQRHEFIAVGWTFAGGEIIQGEKDIFEDVTPESPRGTISDIEFGSLTKADTQSVELSINSSM